MVILSLLLVGLAPPAHATHHCIGFWVYGEAPIPAHGTYDVPTNSSILMKVGSFVEATTPYVLYGPTSTDTADTGDAFDLAMVPASYTVDGQLGILTPIEPLLPNVTYELRKEPDRWAPLELSTFTTADTPDHSAPTGGAEIMTVDFQENWWSYFMFYGSAAFVTPSAGTEEGAGPHSVLYYQVEVATLEGEVLAVVSEPGVPVFLSDGGCAQNLPAETLTPPWSYLFRARAIDASGNVGPWAEQVLVRGQTSVMPGDDEQADQAAEDPPLQREYESREARKQGCGCASVGSSDEPSGPRVLSWTLNLTRRRR